MCVFIFGVLGKYPSSYFIEWVLPFVKSFVFAFFFFFFASLEMAFKVFVLISVSMMNYINGSPDIYPTFLYLFSIQFSSASQSCPTLCDPMDCSTPGLPVHHQLPVYSNSCPLSQ